jgi:hypothetical protein
MKNIIIVGLAVVMTFLAGCTTVTMPNGTKVSKEVYRNQSNMMLMESANRAEGEYNRNNPIPNLPEFCNTRGEVSAVQAATCALAAANANMAMMYRDSNHENSAKYAAGIIREQSRERSSNKDRWFRLFGLIYATERNHNNNGYKGDHGTQITVNGSRVGGDGNASGDQDINIGVGRGNQTGVDNGSSSGYADDYGTTGNFAPDNSDNSSEFLPPLEEVE